MQNQGAFLPRAGGGSFWEKYKPYVMTAVVVMVVIALAVSGGDDDSSGSRNVDQTWVQTWPKSYKSTTCAEFLGDMSSKQQKVAATDMLVGARSVDGAEGFPSDALIRAFWDDVAESCSPIGSLALDEAGVAVYLVGRPTYAP